MATTYYKFVRKVLLHGIIMHKELVIMHLEVSSNNVIIVTVVKLLKE